MKRLPLLNLFKDLTVQRGQLSARKPPGNVGQELFAAFLKKSQRKLFQPEPLVSNSSLKKRGIREKEVLHFLEEISRLLGDIKVSPQMATRLAELLGGQQADKGTITKLISQTSDKDGRVDLMKFFRGAVETGLIRKGQVPDSIVSTPQVPMLAKLLLELGFKVEDVKRILESSMGKEGARSSQVFHHLEKFAPGLPEKKVTEWLAREGVGPKKKDLAHLMSDPQIKGIVDTALKRSEPDHAVRLKLAFALRGKGLAPNEVKQILERLSIEEMKGSSSKPNGSHKAEEEVLRGLVREISANASNKLDDRLKAKARVVFQEVDDKFGPRAKENSDSKTGGIDKWRLELFEPKEKDFQGMKVGLLRLRNEMDSREFSPKVDEIPLPPLRFKVVATSTGLTSPETSASNKVLDIQETISKITEFMKLMVSRGEQEAVIRVSPPDLGELDLKVVVRDGHLQARLSTEAAWVKEMLENNIVHLRHQLEELGFVVAKLEVRVGWANKDQRDGQGSMWDRSRKNRGRDQGAPSSPRPANLSDDALVHVVA